MNSNRYYISRPKKDLLDFDDCFPNGIIVDHEDIDLSEIDQIMANFLKEHNNKISSLQV